MRRYSGTIPRLNPLVLLDVERAQRKLNRMARGAAGGSLGGAAPPASTATEWLRRNLATRPVASCSSRIEAVWAAEPEDLSLLHLLFYVHSAGSLEMLFDAEGGAQQDRSSAAPSSCR